MKNRKKWTREEREAWDRHLDETIRNLRELVEKGYAELQRKEAAASEQSAS